MLRVRHVYKATSAGADGARAFGTGCFKEHLTYDIRGLSDSELKVCVIPLGSFICSQGLELGTLEDVLC